MMNDLSGKCVNVVLAVEMGRGMGFLGHPIKIAANFNERLLESDLVEPDECPMFNTELVWETEKKELRKVRSTNAPLRVEVQFVDKNQRKDRVGFILLSPRCASIIPFGCKAEIPFKWHKLLGVAAENKISHPELYLSLTIRDLSKENQMEQQSCLVDIGIEEEEETDKESEEPFQKDGQVIPIQYLPDGFIQIGNEQATETYVLSITIQVAYNLDLLLPEVLVFSRCREKYFISFQMFGISIKSKPFCRDLHANIPMNEKIVVRIRSEYGILQDYLTGRCQIVVCFYSGRDKLGMTKLSVDSLLQDMPEEAFLSKDCTATCEQKCFFKFPSPHGIIPIGTNNRQPCIEVVTNIKRTEVRPQSVNTISSGASVESITTKSFESIRLSSLENVQAEVVEETNNEIINNHEASSPKENLSPRSLEGCGDAEDEVEKSENKTEANPAISACGDQTIESKVFELQALEINLAENVEEVNLTTENSSEVEQTLTPKIEQVSETSRSDSSILKNAPPLLSPDFTIKKEDINKKVILYQQYCLDVIVENISLKKPIKSKKLFFKFKHPKASSATMIISEFDNEDISVGEDILLENTRCKMFFISTTEHIRKMVYSWGPKLLLVDENDQILTEELDLYTAMFLAKHRFECSYITEWKSLRTYEPLAKLSISMYLQEYGLEALPKPTNFDLLPAILDEEIALKELQEFQEWKRIQTAQFSADLKILEKQRIMKLQRDWAKRKKDLETKLAKSVIRCQNLSQELQAAVNNIRTKKALELKESEATVKSNNSLEDNVQKNTQKYANFKTIELIEKISTLERDNEYLKEIINDQRKEIQQIKKTALTKEQTTNLLQQLRGLEEKFEDAQKAKTYFKEQWKKAVQEIHDLRSEEQKQIQEKIQSHRIELSQLSLDSFTATEGKFDFAQNPFHVSTSHFEDLKWDNLDFSIGLCAPYSSSSTNI
ncbi:hypothetical protein ILUMI_12672 [Ignelater luminosus]|uniref:DUF3668 domain-containing protein n=1 Tax=Ignelater luminosus TaxID=2038154 RepID=A0A8K0G6J5_IGNLU|nr:hypothetical protein ILUMI_12672 [Ignelater luminosus]